MPQRALRPPDGGTLGRTPADLGSDQSLLEFLREEEGKGGFVGDLFFPFDSVEGGTPTLGIGHKLSDSEVASGQIQLGDQPVDFDRGLNQEQVDALATQDIARARSELSTVLAGSRTGVTPDQLDDRGTAVLLELIFNSGGANASQFRKLIRSLADKDFERAAGELDRGIWITEEQATKKGFEIPARSKHRVNPNSMTTEFFIKPESMLKRGDRVASKFLGVERKR